MRSAPRPNRQTPEVDPFGTPQELEYLRVRAEAAVAKDPAQAQALGRLLAAFVRDTAAARARVLATPPGWAETGPEPVPSTRPDSSRITVVTGYAALTPTLMGAMVAASDLLPPKKSVAEADPGVLVWVSIIAAGVVVMAAAVGGMLPSWEAAMTPRQNWQTYYFSAAVLGLGVALHGFNAMGHRQHVGSELWSALLATNFAALVTTLAAAERLRRRTAAIPVVADQPDANSEDAYFGAIGPSKERVLVDLTALTEATPTGSARVVEESWQQAIDEGRRNVELSDRAAASARAMSASRWLVELHTEPDLGRED